MFRIFNVKVIFALLILSGCGDQTPEEHLQQAKAYIEKNARPEAIIELKNILLQDHNNIEARIELASVYISLGDGESAAKEARLALDGGAAPEIAVPLLAKAFQYLLENQEVIDLANEYVDLRDQAKVEVNYYKTLAFYGLNQAERAKETSELINTISPKSKFSKLAQAYLSVNNQNLDTANDIVNNLLIIEPEFVDALYLKGQINFEQKNYKDAINAFKLYENAVPYDRRAKIILAQLFIRNNEIENAQVYLKSLYKVLPRSPIVNQLLAMTYFNQKDFEQAKHYADYAIQNGLDNQTNRLMSGVSAYHLKNNEQVYRNLNAIRDALPKNHPALQILAAAQLELGYNIEAEQTLLQLKQYGLINAELFTTASLLYLYRGETEKAKEMLEISKTDKKEEDTSILTRQAILKLSLKDISAIGDLETIVEESPNAALANVTLAKVYIRTKQYNKALDMAKEWQSNDQVSVQTAGWLLAGEVYSIQKNQVKTDKAFSEVLNRLPNNPAALMHFAGQSLGKDKPKEALEMLSKVLKDSPNYISALAMQYVAHKALGTPGKGIELIAQSYKQNESDMMHLLFYASVLRDIGKYRLAAKTMSKHKIGSASEVPNGYWSTLIDSYEKIGDVENSLISIDKWIYSNPKNVTSHLRKVEFFARNQAYEQALKATEDGLRNAPNEIKLKILEINFLTLEGRLSDAQSKIDKIDTKLVTSAQLAILQGRLEHEKSEYQKAEQNLLHGYTDFPTSVNAKFIFKNFIALDQANKAVAFIQKHIKENPKDISALSILGDYQIQNSLEDALISYKRMLDIDKNNVNALNNVAWVSLRVGDEITALQYSEKAVALAPNHPAILDTYGEALLENGHAKEALDVLTKARNLDPNSNEIKNHFERAKKASGL